ncbi:MAG: hypothetical protein HQ481_21620 [Alphaproteobacteria bacterium]|nr:hypothetical protein [Alphaproteobacteria bacterium]
MPKARGSIKRAVPRTPVALDGLAQDGFEAWPVSVVPLPRVFDPWSYRS